MKNINVGTQKKKKKTFPFSDNYHVIIILKLYSNFNSVFVFLYFLIIFYENDFLRYTTKHLHLRKTM